MTELNKSFFSKQLPILNWCILQIKEELKSVREQASFKAKPSKVVAKEPFIPKKSNKPLTGYSFWPHLVLVIKKTDE